MPLAAWVRSVFALMIALCGHRSGFLKEVSEEEEEEELREAV